MGRNDPKFARERLDTPLTRLTETLLRARTDIETICAADPSPRKWSSRTYLDFHGGPDCFADDCIYDPVDDATGRWLLEDFVDGNSTVGASVYEELSKLLSKRGQLVRDRMDPIVGGILDGTVAYEPHFLKLSYAATMPDGESVVLKLLDIVGSDSRDALFVACYKLNTRAIYEKLTSKVREWDSDPNDVWFAGTGEPWMIRRLCEKWDLMFPAAGHTDVRQIAERHLRRPELAQESN
jgi:hypothetical protein